MKIIRRVGKYDKDILEDYYHLCYKITYEKNIAKLLRPFITTLCGEKKELNKHDKYLPYDKKYKKKLCYDCIKNFKALKKKQYLFRKRSRK